MDSILRGRHYKLDADGIASRSDGSAALSFRGSSRVLLPGYGSEHIQRQHLGRCFTLIVHELGIRCQTVKTSRF